MDDSRQKFPFDGVALGPESRHPQSTNRVLIELGLDEGVRGPLASGPVGGELEDALHAIDFVRGVVRLGQGDGQDALLHADLLAGIYLVMVELGKEMEIGIVWQGLDGFALEAQANLLPFCLGPHP